METWGPQKQELIWTGEWTAAIRSAPWTVWVGTGLLVGEEIVRQVTEPHVAQLILSPFAVLWWALVLVGSRPAWQAAIFFAIGCVVFVFASPDAVWEAAAAVASLPFLLAPSSRRYFRPGRAILPRRVAAMSYEDWEKGGVRQLALRRRVPAYLAPRAVRAFFVACRGRGSGEMSALASIRRREYVIAMTGSDLVVLKLKRPSVFRAGIAATVADLPVSDPHLTWDDEAFTIDGHDYRPIPHHDSDADALARDLRFAREPAARPPS